jgi:uncharacterized protein YneF (UPF0154 family)
MKSLIDKIILVIISILIGIFIGHYLFHQPNLVQANVEMYNGTCWVMP